mmetsp:Transcript_9554/g.24922  ORF Transcript_9554/g.24922 Transcript_9554/m.24922 type:complete len:245 (-) Transcript_9554:1857-2591(-)
MIIGTSLAPSPMLSVMGCGLTPRRTMVTIWRFWSGETRHATTALHMRANLSMSAVMPASSMIVSRALPVTMRARCSVSWPIRSWCLVRHPASCCLTSASVSPLMYSSVISSRSNWHANPMFSAVSCLSPVSTQILTPALARVAMASGTPTWSLSSMAVAPTTTMSLSTSSAALSSAPSLSSSAVVAALCTASHAAHSSSESSFFPSTSVRSPSVAYFPSCSSIGLMTACPGARRSHMTLSAPLT